MSPKIARAAAVRRSARGLQAGSDCLAGSGDACALARSVDWAATPIGPVQGWSQALRSTAALVLHNHSGMLLWWGPEFVQIYNDAYRPVLGDKHPRAMGQRFRDCWSEVFHILGPMAERPFRGGPASTSDDIAVPIHRKVPREEAHFRLAYSPVPDESVETGIGGVLATVTEITDQAYADRQLRTLRGLGTRSAADAQSAELACAIAARVLKENPWDVPFALFYLLDEGGGCARLVASVGFGAHRVGAVAPPEVDLSITVGPDDWPLREVATERRIEIIAPLSRYQAALPESPWAERPGEAIALPLASPDQTHAYGVLICGVSPHRLLDAGYRAFFELSAAQIVASIRDARALEQERKRAEALAAIDRAKTAFFSNVSHEFRTPLTLMLGPVAEALADPALPATARAELDLAHRNALRLLKLVNSLLDFSRIEAGRVQASYEPTDLGELTRDLASNFRSAVERAGLSYTVDCEDLGEPVYVDREMWEKIVLNLLSNALKYTLAGAIRIRMSREGASALLRVTDTGVGIPVDEMPRLFERFHRVEGTAGRTQEGSGIGLALVQELLRIHSGSIRAESELGRGTTFEVRIPLGTAHLPQERIRVPRTLPSAAVSARAFVQEALRWIPSDSTESNSRPLMFGENEAPPVDQRFAHIAGARVLLADDNADMRAYVRGLLSTTYIVEAVEDGERALEAARLNRPDLVLSDIMMPRLDGLALLKALRSDEALRHIPVVLLSARAGEEARIEGLDSGADDYLVKPFSARELLARVGALLELTRIRRENEQRFSAFLSATSDVIYRMSPDWTEMRHLRGRNFVADADRPSRAWLEKYIDPDDQTYVMAAVRKAIRTRSVFQLEHRVRRLDGTLGWTFSRAVPLEDERGEIIEWFGAASDVTERKQMEQELSRQRRLYEAILTNTPDLAYVFDLDHRFIYANEGLLAMWGKTWKEAIGRNCLELGYEPWHAAMHDRELEQVIATRQPVRGEVPFTGAFGRRIYDYVFVPVLRADGEVEAVAGTTRDVTDRKQIEEALREADRRKDEFLAMLAHELRNPLAPIANANELLTRMLAHDTGAQSAIAIIKRQLTQLARLVDDLLDVSRITQGQIELRQQSVELAAVITQAIETVEPQLREKRHKLSVTASRYEPLYVRGDFARLVQCVGNILTNAIKYTEPDGQISVQTSEAGDSACIEISDTGVGISPELLPRVFDLFVQGERTLDRSQGGLGIGLAVVKRLVEMHKGQISVRSAGISRGSTFEIRLPRIARPVAGDPDAPRFKSASRRVLIVDDNADAADSLAMLLRFHGHETQVAYTSEDALACADSFQPDIGLLDLGLPKVNGYGLAQRLLAKPHLKGLRLIALTGYGQAEDRQRTRDAGFEDHLIKPVQLAALERIFAEPRSVGEGA